MSNSAAQPARRPDAASVDILRDEIAAHFVPANAYERVLAANYAAAIARCDTAYQLEKDAFAKMNPLEMLEKHPERFKMVTRYVTDCERGVRRAVEELRRAIRERKKASPQPAASRPATYPAPQPMAPSPTSPMVTVQHSVRKE